MEAICRSRAFLPDFWRRCQHDWWKTLEARLPGPNSPVPSLGGAMEERTQRRIRRRIGLAAPVQRKANSTTAMKMRIKVGKAFQFVQLVCRESITGQVMRGRQPLRGNR